MASVVTDLGHNQSASAGSLVITTTAAVSAGDAIIVPYGTSDGTLATAATNTAGDTAVIFNVAASGAATLCTGVIHFPNSAGMASSSSISVTFTGTPRCCITAMKATLMNTSPLVIRDTSYKQSAYTQSGTGTSSAAKLYQGLAQTTELLIDVVGSGSATLGTFTPTSGFTAIGGSAATCILLPAYKLTTDASPVTTNATWVSSVTYRSMLLAFRCAVASNTARPDGLLTGVGT